MYEYNHQFKILKTRIVIFFFTKPDVAMYTDNKY